MQSDKTSKKNGNIKGLTKGNKKKHLKDFITIRNKSNIQLLMDKARAKSGKEGDTAVIEHALTEYISA